MTCALAEENKSVSGIERLLDNDERKREEAAQDAEVLALVRNVVAYSGLEMNFIIRAKADINNAYATIIDEQRYLIYDPEYLKRIANAAETDWARLGVLAHEIGHHLQGHTMEGGGSTPPNELAADRYAGFVMGLMGANLDQARAHQKLMGEEGSHTHPPLAQRLAATQQGWERARTLPVRRDKESTNACPIIRLDALAKKEATGALVLDGKFIATDLRLRWGHDEVVQGVYTAAGAARKLTGREYADGTLLLEEFSGCVTLGAFAMKAVSDAKPFAAWTGRRIPRIGLPAEAVFSFSTSRNHPND